MTVAETLCFIGARLQSIDENLAALLRGEGRVERQGVKIMGTLKEEYDTLVTAVTANGSKEDSAIQAIQGLAALVKGLGDAPTPEQLHELTDTINSKAAALGAAIDANVAPAAPPPPPPAA